MKEPRIVVFDTETTGTDKQVDQIIELCAQFGLGEDALSKTWRMRPQVEIQPGAQAVHGISKEELADCPLFVEIADELREVFAAADMLVGYNLRFDIEMLQAEYGRLGQAPVDLSNKLIVDPFRLWQQCEPRSLMDAHRRFAGGEFEAAHSASADVAATGRVLQGMVQSFDLAEDWEAIADICEPDRKYWIEGTRHLRWNEQGRIELGFGKSAGTLLSEIAAGPDASYLRWIVDKDFPDHVREACRQALDLSPEDFDLWSQKRFAKPANKTEEAGQERMPASTEVAMGQQSLFPV